MEEKGRELLGVCLSFKRSSLEMSSRTMIRWWRKTAESPVGVFQATRQGRAILLLFFLLLIVSLTPQRRMRWSPWRCTCTEWRAWCWLCWWSLTSWVTPLLWRKWWGLCFVFPLQTAAQFKFKQMSALFLPLSCWYVALLICLQYHSSLASLNGLEAHLRTISPGAPGGPGPYTFAHFDCIQSTLTSNNCPLNI